ncbi:MAG: CDP-glycerol glycerophosphotransferase family protein [Planctomycetota bacterium]
MKIKSKNLLKRLLFAIPALEYTVRLIVLYVYVYRTFYKDKTGHEFSGLNILIVNHHFEQDIDAIVDANKTHRIRVVDNRKLFGLSNCYFAPEEKTGNVIYDKIRTKAKEGYRRQARRIIKLIRRYFPFDVMVVPSDIFFWIREVIYELKEMNIPTIVVDKEGIITPYSFRVHSLEIKERFPFICDRMMVWSERQKQFWIRCGVEEKFIEVIGQPRSDFFFKKNKWKTRKELGLSDDRKVVLFFAYDQCAYIPAELFEQGFSWKEMRTETHNTIKKLAREYPQIDFIIKTHPQARDFGLILNDFSKATHNIKLMGGSSISNHLLVNADIIIGFQTTALIEAMFFKVPILYTFWTASAESFAKELIPFHKSGGVEVIGNAEELEKRTKNFIETQSETVTPYMGEKRVKFIEKYFYTANGQTGERLLEAIERFLLAYNK